MLFNRLLRLHRSLNLRLRLLLVNLLVIGISLGSFAAIVYLCQAHIFVRRLAQAAADSQGTLLPEVIMQVFEKVNLESIAIALTVSTGIVVLLSTLLACSIIHPLRVIERAVKQFNSGDLNARVPPDSIPELNQLGLTLNSVANRLQDIEERRQEMIGDLSHELGTPLTVIRGYLEMLRENTISLTPEITEQLYEEAERMNRLLGDLNTLSRIEAGSLSLRLKAFQPQLIIQEVVTALTASNSNLNCRVELECPANLPQIFADPDRLRQILFNLVGNAIRYTPEGNVTICAWANGNHLWITVSDTGIGIAPEDLPHIFERFWRSPTSQAITAEGSGIGLAVTKRLVEVQGGSIEVESLLGQGSTFRVTFPLACSAI
ncbi:MAG: HAMP domain-containing sensor histidine kinase [Leptolyngbyaceae cyanobacterium bins.302]|nr:HAMP domain-containing sensor histidine kinase [Leptolyngbyaceae cyanobacterium bins.302]